MDQILDFLASLSDVPEDFFTNTLTWLFCLCMFHCTVALIVKPNWPRFAKKDKYIRWSFYNRSVASLHSCVLTYMAFSYWWNSNPTFTLAANLQSDPYSNECVDYMIAYLIYDGLHELTFPVKADKETILHHVLGLVTSITARFMGSNYAIFYYMMIYIAEGSTPFLHWCWGMYAMGFKDTLLFNVVCMLVLVSYLVVRIMLGPFALYHLYTHRDLWSSPVDSMLYLPNFIILIIFNMLNFVWYKALLNKFFAPTTWKKGSEKEMEGAGAGAIRTAAIDEADEADTNTKTSSSNNEPATTRRKSRRNAK